MPIAAAAITAGGALAGGLLSGSGDPATQISGFKALPKNVKLDLRDAIDKSQADFDQGPQQFFGGQTFADLTPDQLAGLQSQLGFSQNQLPQQLAGINQSFGNALNAGSLFNDPSVQAGLGTIENRANQNFSENILPQLRQQATGTGNQFSSKAEQSERLAGRDLQQVISDAQSGFLGNQLGSARGLQGQALGQSPNISQLGLLPGSTQFNVGTALQNQNQLGIAEDVNRFNFGQQADDANLNELIARMTGIANTGGGAGFQSTPTGGTNPFAGALGGAAIGNSLFNSFAPNFGGGGTGSQNLAFSSGGNGLDAFSGFGSNIGSNFLNSPGLK